MNSKLLAEIFKSVSPAVATKPVLPQATMFVLDKGRVYACNDEIIMSAACELANHFSGAVDPKILSYLEKIPEQDIKVVEKDGKLRVKAKKSSAGFAFYPEIQLPLPDACLDLSSVKLTELKPTFLDALAFVTGACHKNINASAVLNCVCFKDKWMESCDNTQAVRWFIEHPLAGCLLPLRNSKAVLKLKPTHAGLTDDWAHFVGSGHDLVLSCRVKIQTEIPYLDVDAIYEDSESNDSFNFSEDVLEQLAPITALGEAACVVMLNDGRAIFRADSLDGYIQATCEISNKELDEDFATWVKVLADTLKTTRQCSVSANFLRFESEDFIHLIARGS